MRSSRSIWRCVSLAGSYGQRSCQLEVQDSFGGNYHVAFSGHGPPGRAGRCACHRANDCSLAATSKAANERTYAGTAASHHCSALTAAFSCLHHGVACNPIRLAFDCQGSDLQRDAAFSFNTSGLLGA
jgi:hypothetical protein